MRFSEAWLRDWVNPPIDTPTLTHQLTMAGLEVDAVTTAAPEFSGVVIGHVLAVEPHPDASKLRVCTVHISTEQPPLAIVCGAANVAAGMKVALAQIGATLPGGMKIKRAKLRGVVSEGMICSAAELGLAESSEGILPLPEDAPVGVDLRTWLTLDDPVIELNLTPDRGDCLSVLGVAREVAVRNGQTLTAPEMSPIAPRQDTTWPVILEAPAACPRYVCRHIRGLNPAAPTPMWMQERLRRSGLRSLGAVVDVTNYVLLELGQPLHAFDAAKLQGAIEVRYASAGERLALLNGTTIELRPESLVIADASGPIALAGIMGGAPTAVSATTTEIVLESAFFTPQALSGQARGYGLHTDSSHRFERGVDPALQARAVERATALLLEIAGGEPGPIVDQQSAPDLPNPPTLTLREQRISRVLGLELPATTVDSLLTGLDLNPTRIDSGWQVQVPSHRFDLMREEDLIAELGRLYGYDQIPVSQASYPAHMGSRALGAFALNAARARLVARGYFEAITYSFIHPEAGAALIPEQPAPTLANPISADLAAMRISLWPGLLQAAGQNLARQQTRVRLFESGLRFRVDAAGDWHQEPMLAGLAIGAVAPEQWGQPTPASDFFDCKSDVESLLALAGALTEYQFVAAEHPALHPGQSAQIRRGEYNVGWLGLLHPQHAARLDLPPSCFIFELELAMLSGGQVPSCAPLSKYPSVRRDLAIVVAEEVTYDQIAQTIREAAGEWLRELVLFDVYYGENIDFGCKSLALGLILQAYSQTLTERRSAEIMERVQDRLALDVGARLRS